jgi:hypothetical protein
MPVAPLSGMVKACVAAVTMLAWAVPAMAASLSIAWDPNEEPEVSGYLVHYGTDPGTYSDTVDVGSRTSFTIANLVEGRRYYVAVTAYSADGVASSFSPEVSAVVAAATPSSGLVAAYGFEETSGVVVTDSSPARNHGVIAGPVRTASGRFGRALSFDGLNDLVTIADSPALDLSDGMTVEAWVRPTALSGWRSVVLKERADGLAYGLYAHENAQRPAATVHVDGDISAAGTGGLPLNAWTHIAATHDGATVRLYVNGALAGTTPASGRMPETTDALRIGGNLVWGEYFSGRIDEVRIYNRALPATEIARDMNTMIVSGLVAAYGFEEADGSTAGDASGSGHDGTIDGATRTAGRFGQGLAFDGLDDVVTIPGAATLTGAKFTVEAWVYPTALSGWRTAVMKEAADGLVWGLYAHDNAPRPAVTAAFAGVDTSAPAAKPLPLNAWTHLAATYDGATLKLFVNGAQAGKVAATGTVSTSADPLRIGGNSIWGEYFSGRIDEVRVYDRWLSAAEIQVDMNRPVAQ